MVRPVLKVKHPDASFLIFVQRVDGLCHFRLEAVVALGPARVAGDRREADGGRERLVQPVDPRHLLLHRLRLRPYRRHGPAHVRAQIQAVYDVGLKEWVLWSPGSNYDLAALAPEGGPDPVFDSLLRRLTLAAGEDFDVGAKLGPAPGAQGGGRREGEREKGRAGERGSGGKGERAKRARRTYMRCNKKNTGEKKMRVLNLKVLVASVLALAVFAFVATIMTAVPIMMLPPCE